MDRRAERAGEWTESGDMLCESCQRGRVGGRRLGLVLGQVREPCHYLRLGTHQKKTENGRWDECSFAPAVFEPSVGHLGQGRQQRVEHRGLREMWRFGRCASLAARVPGTACGVSRGRDQDWEGVTSTALPVLFESRGTQETWAKNSY